jgi:hypothetical protein
MVAELGREKLIKLERAIMEEIKRRMEDLGMWAGEGSEQIGSG